MTDKLAMPIVLRNAGKEAAVNVKVEEILVGNWRATFPLVPHIIVGNATPVLASVEYDGMQIETVANHLISLLRPATNAGMKESRTTPARITYTNARGEQFTGAYEFRWDHVKRECTAVLIALTRRAL